MKCKSTLNPIAAVLLGLALPITSMQADELKPGDPAPEFELKASDGRTYKLSGFRGKQAVIVAWFPKAFTPGCTIECKAMARDGDALKTFDVAYFTASVDSVEANTKFAKSVGADYPILSDPEKKVAKAYGVVDEKREFPRRWTFVIGKDGEILFIDKSVKPASHPGDIAAKLKELGIATKG